MDRMATTEKPHEPNKEWVKVFDLDYSRYYFYNIPSGETHWELPSAIDDHDVIVAGAPESITALVVPRGEGAAAARLADVVMDNVTTGPRFILTPSEPIPGLPSPPLSPTLGPVEGGPRKSRIRSVVKGFANALGLRKKKKGAGPVEGGDDEAAGSGGAFHPRGGGGAREQSGVEGDGRCERKVGIGLAWARRVGVAAARGGARGEDRLCAGRTSTSSRVPGVARSGAGGLWRECRGRGGGRAAQGRRHAGQPASRRVGGFRDDDAAEGDPEEGLELRPGRAADAAHDAVEREAAHRVRRPRLDGPARRGPLRGQPALLADGGPLADVGGGRRPCRGPELRHDVRKRGGRSAEGSEEGVRARAAPPFFTRNRSVVCALRVWVDYSRASERASERVSETRRGPEEEETGRKAREKEQV